MNKDSFMTEICSGAVKAALRVKARQNGLRLLREESSQHTKKNLPITWIPDVNLAFSTRAGELSATDNTVKEWARHGHARSKSRLHLPRFSLS
jgi:hypothetical protein